MILLCESCWGLLIGGVGAALEELKKSLDRDGAVPWRVRIEVEAYRAGGPA